MTAPVSSSAGPDQGTLRATIEELASLERLPTSEGERQAALVIGERLRELGCDVAIEEERAHPSYARPVAVLSAIGVASAVAAGRGHRALGALGGAMAAAGVVDECSGGTHLFRRLVQRPGTAWNVVARGGDPEADRTLVVLAHHDAAPSGVVFDQRWERWFARRFPRVVESMTENPPLWMLVFGAPAAVAVGSALGSRRLRRAGLVWSLAVTAAMADIARRRAVPGANDNLSGVAALVAIAEALRDRPLRGLRVWLVSAGAEEALQEGIRGFARRHFRDLSPERTWFLNMDTVGSPNLVMLEGEGTLLMEDFEDGFKDLVEQVASAEGITLHRGARARNSTDSVVPNRAGYPVATLVSVDDDRLIPNYHLYTDTPENVNYATVADAARLTEAVARALAEGAMVSPPAA